MPAFDTIRVMTTSQCHQIFLQKIQVGAQKSHTKVNHVNKHLCFHFVRILVRCFFLNVKVEEVVSLWFEFKESETSEQTLSAVNHAHESSKPF